MISILERMVLDMMKKWLAVLTAVAMLLCFAGCGTAPSEEKPDVGESSSETEALTYEELLELLGMAGGSGSSLTLPVNWTVYNSEELTSFMQAVTFQQPTEYTNTLNEYAADGTIQEVTYTVNYDGASATVTRTVDGAMPQTAQIAQFGMMLLANACVDATGSFDQMLFAQQMELLDMSLLFEQYPYYMLYGVNAVVALTTEGQYVVFDYYFDESADDYVDQMLADYGM